MVSALPDRIPLPNGRYLAPVIDLLFVVKPVPEGRGQVYQAIWRGNGYCVGYGDTPKAAAQALYRDTADRWMATRPRTLPDGKPSAALEAWDWVHSAFREVS